ncbi:MAG: SpoIID/LytB domain-containing protein, partial [Bacteroidales bacterium]|nr:SpoIID/LytB domain-containing protein [Bacteroidales bacterium]
MKLSIKIHILLITLLLLSIGLKAQKLDIRIFTDTKLNEISFIPSFGRYFVEIDNKKQSIKKSDIVRIKTQADKVSLYINDSLIGNYKELKFSSEGLMSFFLLRTKDTNLIKDRRYDDNLIVKVKNKDLFLINNIETESYIAGVVQAETWGATTNVDFFKLQAICVRNYLFKNLNKHKAEGFHLCDGVH